MEAWRRSHWPRRRWYRLPRRPPLRRPRLLRLPRVLLIETEYQRAVIDAEARWLSAVIDDLKSGKLCWDQEQITAQAAETFSQATSP